MSKTYEVSDMSGGLNVRLALPGDEESILSCLRAAFEPFREQYTLGAYRDTVLTAESLAERISHMAVFVAADDKDQIVGTIAAGAQSLHEGHLRGMSVLPEWQGKGVADELLIRAEEELRSRACLYVTLDTTEPLQRAIRFYERHGFRATGRVTDFYGMPLYEYSKTLRRIG
jgi:ribosomal protein S18 acetylase RimI-like enzyme